MAQAVLPRKTKHKCQKFLGLGLSLTTIEHRCYILYGERLGRACLDNVVRRQSRKI